MDFSKSPNIQDRLTHNAVVGPDKQLVGFKASDFVRVMNIDDESYNWKFCTEEEIQVDQSGFQSNRTSKVDDFSLEPGQVTEMPGNIALVFIEGLVKHMIQKEGKAKMINIASVQDEWINRIFLGVKDMPLPYATTSIDPETGSRTYKASPLVKDPIDTFSESPFPEITETKKVGRPAKATI
jgi:hypothetical protein